MVHLKLMFTLTLHIQSSELDCLHGNRAVLFHCRYGYVPISRSQKFLSVYMGTNQIILTT